MSRRVLRSAVWWARFSFRFFSGRPLFSARKTNATFWKPATRSLDPSGEMLRWEAMRGAARAAWRCSAVYLLLLLPLLLLLLRVVGELRTLSWALRPENVLLLHVLLGGATALLLLLRHVGTEYGWPRVEWVEKEDGEPGEEGEGDGEPSPRRRTFSVHLGEGERVWRKEKLEPLARSLSVVTGHSIPDRRAGKWVTVPKEYREGAPVELMLPPYFTGSDENVKTRLVRSVSAKLGMEKMDAHWLTEGSSPRVLLTAPPVPPEYVEFSDVREFLENSEEYRPFIGLQGNGEPYCGELIADSPHTGVSAGPGAGKSTLAKEYAAQALRWGWGVVVLDWKQSGAFDWLGGLEGVTYLTEIEDIHDMGITLGEEVNDRKRNGLRGGAKVLVIRDEWNVTAPLLKEYWETTRQLADKEEKKTMPLRSPALSGYAVLDFAGREYGLFDFCVAQRFSSRIFNGNADIRECFAVKLLARYSPQTVKMLAPDIKPFPRKNNREGRWVAVNGDTATVVQAPMITNDEARALAAGGLPNPSRPLRISTSQRLNGTFGQGKGLRSQGVEIENSPLDAQTSSPVNWSQRGMTLRDLSDALPLGLSVLRKAANSDEAFPAAVAGDQFKGYEYELKAVQEWAANRPAKKVSK